MTSDYEHNVAFKNAERFLINLRDQVKKQGIEYKDIDWLTRMFFCDVHNPRHIVRGVKDYTDVLMALEVSRRDQLSLYDAARFFDMPGNPYRNTHISDVFMLEHYRQCQRQRHIDWPKEYITRKIRNLAIKDKPYAKNFADIFSKIEINNRTEYPLSYPPENIKTIKELISDELFHATGQLDYDQIHRSSNALSLLNFYIQNYFKIISNHEGGANEHMSPELHFIAATYYATGRGFEKNVPLAMTLYEEVLKKFLPFYTTNNNPLEESTPVFMSLRNWAIRRLLGYETSLETELTKKVIDTFVGARCDCHEIYERIDTYFKKLNNIHPSLKALHDQKNADGDFNFEAAIKKIRSSNNSVITENTYSLILTLAAGENWENFEAWQELAFEAKAQIYRIDPDQVNVNTLSVGPFYNPILDNGLPVIGEYRAINYNFHTESSFIEPGAFALNSVTGKSDGTIAFNFENNGKLPRLIWKEDVDVALALVFANQGSTAWPSIDIPLYQDQHGQKQPYFQPLELTPEWLRGTDFAKTLYITDFLAGRLCWNIQDFPIVLGSDIAQKFDHLAKHVISIEKPAPKNMTAVVNTNPVNFYSHTSASNGMITVTFAGIDISIDGGYLGPDSKTWHHRNDSRFKQGERAAFLTENFNDIAQAIPVFERLRQLMGLVYSLDKLKQSGFTPSTAFTKYCQKAKNNFETMQHAQPVDYVRPIPLYSLIPKIGCR